MNCQHLGKLIHAYHDGELDIAATLEVEEHLAGCPRCAALARSLPALSGALRNDALRYQAPAALQQRIRAAARQATAAESEVTSGRPWFHYSGWTVAAALALIGFILALDIPGGRRGSDRMIAEITSSHVRSLMPNHLMDVASTDQHTVKPWFDGKLDFAPPVKDFKAEGFPLVGGRLDYVGGRPVAALVYGRQKHVINLFVWPADAPKDAAPSVAGDNGYHLIRWSSSGMLFWAVSDLNEKELLEFAQLWSAR